MSRPGEDHGEDYGEGPGTGAVPGPSAVDPGCYSLGAQ